MRRRSRDPVEPASQQTSPLSCLRCREVRPKQRCGLPAELPSEKGHCLFERFARGHALAEKTIEPRGGDLEPKDLTRQNSDILTEGLQRGSLYVHLHA